MDSAEVFSPGPLPIITAVAEECGLVETLDAHLVWDEQQCLLSPGQRLLAIIMNCLTEGEPLYRMPEFFQSTDTENLFDEGVMPEHLNDDALGRGLDKLAEADGGPQQVLGTVYLEAAAREGVETRVLHADTTTVSVQGLYEDPTDEETLSITHGFSKDNRPDLKQFGVGLGVNREGVPIVGDILDGNASDKTWNTDLIEELHRWIDTDEPPVYVADSAAATKGTLTAAIEQGIHVISRLPRTYSAATERVEQAWDTDEWIELGTVIDRDDAATYKLQSFRQAMYDRELRCVVVHSSTLDARTERAIEKDLQKTKTTFEDAVADVTGRYFACEPDVEDALEEWLAKHASDYFEIDATIVETERKKSRDKPGRPPKDWDPYETAYQIEASVSRDEDAIADRKSKASCFVLVTTILDDEAWSDEEILAEYKAQQVVERRFPVLKDPKRVGAIFLKDPDRVEALGYVLLLALLVYSLIERRARRALEHAEEPMALAGGKTSFRPTGRRVLERFENAMVMRVGEERTIPENADVPVHVLELLGLSMEVFGVEQSH